MHHRPARPAALVLAVIAFVVSGCSSDDSAVRATAAATLATSDPTTPPDPTAAPVTTSEPPATTAAPVATSEPPATTAAPVATSEPPATTAAPVTTEPVDEPVLAAAVGPVGTVTHASIVVDGVERTYRLYIPSELPDAPVPLVLAFHGGFGWGDQFAQTNHVESLAESNGFIAVHPDGVKMADSRGGTWNGGACCGRATREDVDDVGFVAALIDSLEASYSIDPGRVVAFGHSNGAIMSYRLACELSDRITGVGMWAGALEIDTCTPARPVSILHGHGDADRNVPIDGGVGPDSVAGVDFAVPHEGYATIADAAGCTTSTTVTDGDLTIEQRDGCADATSARFVTIHTATHAWPGGTPRTTPAGGAGYAGWNATAEIVGFLLAHPRP